MSFYVVAIGGLDTGLGIILVHEGDISAQSGRSHMPRAQVVLMNHNFANLAVLSEVIRLP